MDGAMDSDGINPRSQVGVRFLLVLVFQSEEHEETFS